MDKPVIYFTINGIHSKLFASALNSYTSSADMQAITLYRFSFLNSQLPRMKNLKRCIKSSRAFSIFLSCITLNLRLSFAIKGIYAYALRSIIGISCFTYCSKWYRFSGPMNLKLTGLIFLLNSKCLLDNKRPSLYRFQLMGFFELVPQL